MDKTYMLIVLHAHFPAYKEDDKRLEQLLFEQLSNIYLPILSLLKDRPNNSQPIIMAFSPSFLEILSKKELMKNYHTYLMKQKSFVQTALKETNEQAEIEMLTLWLKKNEELNKLFLECHGEFIPLIRKCLAEGLIVGVGSGPADIPLTESEHKLREQVELSLSVIEKHLNFRPRGYWIPDGMYSPALDITLSQAEIRYTWVNEKNYHSLPERSEMNNAPVLSPEGIMLLPVKERFSNLVREYMADDRYLDPVKDLAYEKKWQDIKEFALWPQMRMPSGIKTYRRSQTPQHKERYVYKNAMQAIQTHTTTFLQEIEMEKSKESANAKTVMTTTFDFFKMRWLEGPLFLESILKLVASASNKEICSPESLLQAHYPVNHQQKPNLPPYFGGEREPCSQQTFQDPINIDVFYSERKAHIHLLHEEKKRKKQRILMLTWEFPPSVLGGLGKHVWELSSALSKEAYEVYIITPSFLGAPCYERIGNIHVIRVKGYSLPTNDFHLYVAQTNMNMVERVMELCEQVNLDIIHAHDWLVGLAARYLKERFGFPLVTTIHALEHGRSLGSRKTIGQQRTYDQEVLLIEESNEIIVCSPFMEKEVHHLSSSRKKIHVIPNGVDSIEADSASIRSLISKFDYNHLVFTLGRIVPEKGFDVFIKAAGIVLQTYPKSLFVIAGKGPMLSAYRDLVSELELEKSIIFVGFLYDQEKATMLHLCDMLVIPSLYEPFGIVALEGMAAERAVIASETGGLVSIISDNQTGILFPPGDEKSLADKIESLLKTPTFRLELGKNAKCMVNEKYRWEDVRQRTEAVYDTSLATSSVQ